MDGQDGDGHPALTTEEIGELTRVFPPGSSAVALLRRAGFPTEHIPAATTAAEFWSAVAGAVAAGRVADGRLRVLAAACATYPHNEVFRAAVREPGGGGVRRVLVTGAAPGAQELAAVRRAARGVLTVDGCPAAAAADLRRILTVRPDVLHLVCRREGHTLVFEDGDGQAYRTPAARLAELLTAYRRLTGAPLLGVVLGCPDGAPLAALFARAAEVVVAHRGPLDGAASAAFADGLYALLGEVPTLAQAARGAAERIGADGNGVVVLRGRAW
ncbi:effector-associated domain EAD1-containing protein [Streptomyces malaysiensis]|uniref:effector-associated domain EAD1-containing protein n=1 Tax=Streptomyces malaysiensis TaxID=92644 RepID=UPI002B2A9BD9|nr:effector-associated domain EAD1-containing protein [Streptomyces malaysiensis]